MFLINFKFGHYLAIILILLFFNNSIYDFVESQRACELQGSCFRCEYNRYSFYTCKNNEDCFNNEYCNLQKFCCPIKLLSLQIEELTTIMPDNVYESTDKNLQSFVLHQTQPNYKSNFLSLMNFALESSKELNLSKFHIKKCDDSKKNYLTCGSACPAGCNDLNPKCASQCKTGCFCRAPYVLENSKNLSSSCVLPYNCLNFHAITSCNSKSNRIWTTCASKSHCYRNCERLSTFQFSIDLFAAQQLDAACATLDCHAGCECQLPFVWQNSSDLNSECVLPADCPLVNYDLNSLLNKTESLQKNKTKKFKNSKKQKLINFDQQITTVSSFNAYNKCSSIKNKEFLNCASSCPLGCDNLELRLCTPCVSGCFCKNGYVFENSSNWNESECVLISDCKNLTKKQNASQQKDEHVSIEDNISTNEFNETKMIAPSISQCSSNFFDINSRSCVNDFDCGYQQKCCKINVKHEIINKNIQIKNNTINKCTCIDPNAVWIECGTVCPDFCYKDEIKDRFCLEDCPPICHAACFCKNGFIKKTRDPTSPCIPILDCPDFFQLNHN